MASMSRTLSCPHCSATLRANRDVRGREVRCPKCRQAFRVPASPAADVQQPAPAVRTTRSGRCPCGQQFVLPDGPEDTRVQCPGCERWLILPGSPSAAAAGPVSTWEEAGQLRPLEDGAPSAAASDLWDEPLPVPTKRCSACGATVAVDAAVCIRCGTNLKTGRRLLTRVRVDVDREAEQIRSWVRWVSLILPVAIVPYRSTIRQRSARAANWTLVIATCAISALLYTLLLGENEQVIQLALWPGDRFALYQLVSYLFLHGGPAHLVSNIVAMWMFGAALNATLGSYWYPSLYLALGVLAGLFGHLVFWPGGEPIPLVGASGAVTGLMGVYLVLFPRHDVHMALWLRPWFWLPPIIKTFPLMGLYAVLFFVAYDVLAIALGLTGNVAHSVHISGFVSGVVIGLVLLLTGLAQAQGYDLLTWIMGDRWRWVQIRIRKALPSRKR
jgi:predicted Zn finger-like uncharacterized protein